MQDCRDNDFSSDLIGSHMIKGTILVRSFDLGSFNKLVPGANSRGRSKPTDRFRRIVTLGSYRIPTLGIRMSSHNRDSDRIFMKSRRILMGSDCRIESPGKE
jgi:hypothetical protein